MIETSKKTSFVTRSISARNLVESYDTILLDAYGVLVSSEAAIPHALAFIDHLNKIGKEYRIVSNDASKLPATALARYRGFGLNLCDDSVLSSGSLLKSYFETERLVGARCVVLGPNDSKEYVKLAGGSVVEVSDAFDVLVVCDEMGFQFLETMDKVLSALIRKIARGDSVRLIAPNPDLIYPSSQGFGFASGTMAQMFEEALKLRFPGRNDLCFTRLGKPFSPIFEEARRRCRGKNMVMIGDQLETDIRGASNFGIDSALVATGIVNPEDLMKHDGPRPTFQLTSLAL